MGQFSYWHDPSQLWDLPNLRKVDILEVDYNDIGDDHNIPVDELSSYASPAEELLYAIRDDILTEIDSKADEPVRLM